MARVGDLQINPGSIQSLAGALTEVIRVLDALVSIGDPLSPYDDQSLVRAGDTSVVQAHNGQPGNIFGAWVEKEIDTPGGAVTFNHNLGLTVIGADEPNVRWLVVNFRHDGTTGGGGADEALQLVYEDDSCVVGSDSIDLVLQATGSRTVDSDHPVFVSVFFVPVTRWVTP